MEVDRNMLHEGGREAGREETGRGETEGENIA